MPDLHVLMGIVFGERRLRDRHKLFGGSSDDMAQDAGESHIAGRRLVERRQRKAAYTRAIKRITQAYMIPMATFDHLRRIQAAQFRPWADEMPRFYLSTWK